MNNKFMSHQFITAGLAITLGLLLTLGLLAGLALAQEPESNSDETGYWLVLDSSRPVDEILPPLLGALAALKGTGQIIDFEPTPQASASNAASAVYVTAQAGQHDRLGSLPGVLAALDALPPAPPEDVGIQATTSITGRVTEVVSPTNPISGAMVDAFDGLYFIALNTVNSDANGVYSTTVNPVSNQVKVRFQAGGYATEWYNDKISFGSADVITASGGIITNQNAQLARADGAITGTLTFTPGGQPVDGATVNLFKASDGSFTAFSFTNISGIFQFTNLISDQYKLQFTGGSIVSEFYQDQTSLANATVISVTTGATQTITAQVEGTAVITGRVTDTVTALPLAFAPVQILDLAGNTLAFVGTDINGNYTATGFGSGSYKILFNAVGYNPELYDDVPTDFSSPPQNLAQASVVTATAGQTRTNINAGLTPALANITGRVTGFDGSVISNGVDGPRVDLVRIDPNSGQIVQNFASLTADPSTGVYTHSNLSNGVYKLFVGGEIGNPNFPDNTIIPHAPEWYSNTNVLTTGTRLTITNGISQTGIDVQLAAGGCIAGRIVDGTGTAQNFSPLAVLQVENNNQEIAVFAANGNPNPVWQAVFLGSPATSDNNGQGEFRACGLASGNYILSCDGNDLSFFSNLSGQRISATVTAGQVTDVGVCTVGLTNLYLPVILKN